MMERPQMEQLIITRLEVEIMIMVKKATEVPATPQASVPSYRYVRYIGYGDNTSATTSRLVELQAMAWRNK